MRVMFGRNGRMRLEEIDDFTGFAAHAVCAPEVLDAGLTGAGCRDHDAHLWIDRGWVLANGRPADPQWRAAFDNMVAFAESRGWVDSDGAIRAHLVWSDPAASDRTQEQGGR
jgi:hypothetical protein